MTGLLEPLGAADHDAVLALNERHQHLTAPMDLDRLRHLDEVGTVEVIRDRGRFGGFVVTVTSGATFDSENFAWFAERYDRYCYLDRIVVHEDARRLGLARRVYDELEARTAQTAPLLTLEVNTDPPNEASLAFHAGRGFEQVGERFIVDHTVAMMVKRLAP
ncbi:GNAT family N-acetyltransferase [Nocardioides euryhalodurans]|uniref:GNAT family N-acetyltransferase n=1 Tax=Nocardioides euryhalodurans TaxID=2518370 RepID=A0A4P7GN22_9ACTN|nr:GNAT family N-acetyltransferase [Nocardioides euryhalodurans]QBR93566.1 GNAT family N-acetyltransferase [Nocardioides euryhalodurans]